MSLQSEFKILTDEHIPNAVSEELKKRDVVAVRLIDVISEGTPDSDVLEYCHLNEFALITADVRIRGHIKARTESGKEHGGIFIASQSLGANLVGTIVEEISFIDDAIKVGAASYKNDVYNQISYIK